MLYLIYTDGNKKYSSNFVDNKSELYSLDTRNENFPPSHYKARNGRGMYLEFKDNSKIGLSTDFTYPYSFLITLIPYGDISGGYPIQIAFSNHRCWHRYTSDWSSWNQSWVSLW